MNYKGKAAAKHLVGVHVKKNKVEKHFKTGSSSPSLHKYINVAFSLQFHTPFEIIKSLRHSQCAV